MELNRQSGSINIVKENQWLGYIETTEEENIIK